VLGDQSKWPRRNVGNSNRSPSVHERAPGGCR
jgi:hypothetical protein